ncbi:MAG: methylated-DNA--[protein]-cysteine S-methyltransferase [Pirellulaceae bacterium]
MISTSSTSRYYATMASPLGELLLIGLDDCLTGVYIREQTHAPKLSAGDRHAPMRLSTAIQQLEEYFAGERIAFDLSLNLEGTPFQQRVWRCLREIPYGVTWSYGELATRLGNKDASRAVGAANGRNPISIIVPCHRVIGANGSLTGYGGGLAAKRWLLQHEAQRRGLFDPVGSVAEKSVSRLGHAKGSQTAKSDD